MCAVGRRRHRRGLRQHKQPATWARRGCCLSLELQEAWVRFTTTGNPGWPAFNPRHQLTRILDSPSTTARYPEQTSRDIWAGHPITAYDIL
ncbi:hypothetical protein SUDANB120_00053 [Streptomyces sp. enrichment culture]|uniref:hypothetical protein n=1 Tax=Streptomyces sp. enrichment culture TaxID=1795815 RepID=UPI003F561FF7